MSFKKILLEKAVENIPDFTFDAQKSTNTIFFFYKEDNLIKYEVWFQIARHFPEFVVELEVADNRPTKWPELHKKKGERLGHLAYEKDYWWQYQKGDENSIVQAINQAFEVYKTYAPSYFAKSSQQILA